MKGTTSEDGCMKATGVPAEAIVLYVDIVTGQYGGRYNIGVPYRFNSTNEIGIAVYSEAGGNERVKNTEITANVYYIR